MLPRLLRLVFSISLPATTCTGAQRVCRSQLLHFGSAICLIMLSPPGVPPAWQGHEGSYSSSFVLCLWDEGFPFHLGNGPGGPRKFPFSSSAPVHRRSFIRLSFVAVYKVDGDFSITSNLTMLLDMFAFQLLGRSVTKRSVLSGSFLLTSSVCPIAGTPNTTK